MEPSERNKLLIQFKKRLTKRWPRASWWVRYFIHQNTIGYYNNYGFVGLIPFSEVESGNHKLLMQQWIRIPMRYRRRIGKVAYHYEPVDTAVIMNSKHFNECRHEYGRLIHPLAMAEWMRALSVDIDNRCDKCKLGYVANYANTCYYEYYKCVLCGSSYTVN